MFNPEAVIAAIPEFRPQVSWPDSGAADDYSRYYALDEERRQPGLHHAGGWVAAAGYRILLHFFRPSACRGVLFIVHGYLEHSGLYPKLLPLALRCGYAVVIFDLPGHGLSSGARVSIHDFAEYQQVLTAVLRAIPEDLPGPRLAMGQSTGGAILMERVLAEAATGGEPPFARLLLLAPLVLPTRLQWWQIRGAFWLYGALRTSTLRSFRRNTADEAFLHFIRREDPLQARWIPVAWVMAMKEWVVRIHRYPPADYPVWLVQGVKDATVNGPYNYRFIRRRFRVMVSLQLADASHQLANERDDIRAPVDRLLMQFLTS